MLPEQTLKPTGERSFVSAHSTLIPKWDVLLPPGLTYPKVTPLTFKSNNVTCNALAVSLALLTALPQVLGHMWRIRQSQEEYYFLFYSSEFCHPPQQQLRNRWDTHI